MDTPPTNVRKPLANSLTKTSVTPCRRVGLGRPSSGSLTKSVQLRAVSTPTPAHSPSHLNQTPLSTIAQNKTVPTPDCDSPRDDPYTRYDEHYKAAVRVRRCLKCDLKANNFLNVKSPFDKRKKIEIGISHNEANDSCNSAVEESKSNIEVKKFKSYLSATKTCKGIAEGHQNRSSFRPTYKTESTKTTANFEDDSKVITEEAIAHLLMTLLEKKNKLEQLKAPEKCKQKHDLEELQALSAKWRSAGQEALRHCVRLARQAGYSVTVRQLMVQHGFPPALMGYNSDDDEFD